MNEDIYKLIVAVQLSAYKTAQTLESSEDKSILYKNAFGILTDNMGIVLNRLELDENQLNIVKEITAEIHRN